MVVLSLELLQDACRTRKIIVLPIAYKGCNGKERKSYINVFLEKVNPLGERGDSYFKGQTVPTNGEEPTLIDGFTSVKPMGKINGHGRLMVYNDE